MDCLEIILDLLSTEAEQWTDDLSILGTNTCQTMNACPTDKVHKQRLNSIITMVGDTYIRRSDILTKLTKIAITQIACSHFNAYLM